MTKMIFMKSEKPLLINGVVGTDFFVGEQDAKMLELNGMAIRAGDDLSAPEEPAPKEVKPTTSEKIAPSNSDNFEREPIRDMPKFIGKKK